jgi:hypothetical protein
MKFRNNLNHKSTNLKSKPVKSRQETSFKIKENEIKQKDNQIQEELIKFCKVLQETEAKKNRALKRF